MIDIALARPTDLPDIHKMVRALSAFHNERAGVTFEQLQDKFFAPCPMATALLARQDGRAVGYAGLTPTMVIHDGKIRIDIHHLFVHEGHRSKGIGTALIKAAKAHALSRVATRLTIGTDPNNATAIAAYRAMPQLEEITGSGPRFRVTLDAQGDQ